MSVGFPVLLGGRRAALLRKSTSYSLSLDALGRSTDAVALTTSGARGGSAVWDGVHTVWSVADVGAVIEIGVSGASEIWAYLPTILGGTPATGLLVKVDGVVRTPVYLAGPTSYGKVKLAGGLYPGVSHRCEIAFTGLGGNCYIESTQGGGANPSFVAYGPTAPTFIFPPGRGSVIYLSEQNYVVPDGGWEQTPYFTNWTGFADGFIGVGNTSGRRGTASWIRGVLTVPGGKTDTLRYFCLNGAVEVSLDGGATFFAPVDCSTGTTYFGWSNILTGIPPGTYNVVIANSCSVASGFDNINQPVAVMSVNGTWTTTPIPVRPRLTLYGDSLTINFKNSGPVLDVKYCLATLLQQSNLGLAVEVESIPGSTIVGDTPGSGKSDTGDVTGRTPVAAKICTIYGANDDASTGPAQTALQSATQLMVNSIAGTLDEKILYVCGPFLSGSNSAGTIATKNTVMQAGITAAALPNVVFLDASGVALDFTNPPANDTLDGVHWNQSGNAKVSAFLQPKLWTPDVSTACDYWATMRSGSLFKAANAKVADGDTILKILDRRDAIAGPTHRTATGTGAKWQRAGSNVAASAVPSYALSSALSYAGPFGLYFVGSAIAGSNCEPISHSTINNAVAIFNNGNTYVAGPWGQIGVAYAPNGKFLLFVWRDASNAVRVQATGLASSLITAAGSGTWALDTLMAWVTNGTSLGGTSNVNEIAAFNVDPTASGGALHTSMLAYVGVMNGGLTL